MSGEEVLKIFRYEVSCCGSNQVIELPIGAEIISAGNKKETDDPCFWALVNPNNPKEKRTFTAIATGEPITIPCEKLKLIGRLDDGFYISHLFEVLG